MLEVNIWSTAFVNLSMASGLLLQVCKHIVYMVLILGVLVLVLVQHGFVHSEPSPRSPPLPSLDRSGTLASSK